MKKIGITLALLAALILVLVVVNWQKVTRLHYSMTLFERDKIVHNFSHMDEVYPVEIIPAPAKTHQFGSRPVALPATYRYRGEDRSLPEFLAEKMTTGLLVLKGNDITYEEYFLGTADTDHRLSNSVAKSFLSALFGVAVHEGDIKSLDQPVTDYVPELRGSGYDGVAIRDVLEMSSGVKFSEDYGDFHSDINRFLRVVALGRSFDDFAASLEPETEPGTVLHYVSIDTHVLGMVLRQATGREIGDYFNDKLWSKIGAESSAYYVVDDEGQPMVLGGLNIRTRDSARFGKLFLDNGVFDGEQVIPRDWVLASTRSQSAHTRPTQEYPGYGYQWWLPPGADGEFMAVGIYDQFIYVNQKLDVVIVKNTANANFTDPGYTGFFSENTAVFRAIAESVQ